MATATWIALAVVVVGALTAIRAFVSSRSGRRPTTAGPEPAQLPLTELDASSQHALIATDNAVRASQEELGFATAEVGDEAAAPFADALAEAKAELMAAFRIRQALDDGIPDDGPTRRRLLTEIIERCRRADARLDAEATSFDRLRDLVGRAPAALAAAEHAAAVQAGRVAAATDRLQHLRTDYADSATAPVIGHPQQIADRLAFANDCLGAARVALAGEDRRRAAVLIRAAEAGIEQAGVLLDALNRRSAELDAAARRLPAALAELESDLAGRPAGARQVLAVLRHQMFGRYDPIEALRRAEEATALLDAEHGREPNDHRARKLLEQATLTAGSEIAATEDFIATRRGAVGSQARTRLAEAERLLQQSAEASQDEPSQALAMARHADSLAREAMATAQCDTDRFRSPYSSRSTSMDSAALGGIIPGDVLGGDGTPGGSGGGRL